MGSGTTLIAAETTGRVCLGIELNPAYVDVAVERWQRFTGKAAVLEGSGESFNDLAARAFGVRERDGLKSSLHLGGKSGRMDLKPYLARASTA